MLSSIDQKIVDEYRKRSDETIAKLVKIVMRAHKKVDEIEYATSV